MATLGWRPGKDGRKKDPRVQYYRDDGKRETIYLGNVTVKVAEFWLRRIEALIACQTSGVAHDRELAEWLRELPDRSYDKLASKGLVRPREKAEIHTVEQLTKAFVARSPAKPSTVIGYKQTLDSLVEFFGATRPLTSITPEGADEWRVWVVGEKKGSGRRKKKRTTDDNRLSGPTVAKRVSVAKQVFRTAVRWGWIPKSPFDALKPGSQANPSRRFYVDQATTRDVLAACPSLEWKVVVALSRCAGLRCPSEVGAVTWADVDWERGSLTVRSKKTEHHGADHAVREVPISQDLRELLRAAREEAGPGATSIAPMAGRIGVNLGTQFKRIVKKAGHKVWPRAFQNLRASFETDQIELGHPAHVVARWLGHSPKVAAQHYLIPLDHHFQKAAGRSFGLEAGASGGEITNAKSNAVATLNPTLRVTAGICGVSHETTEPAATTRVTAGSSRKGPVVKTGEWRGQDSNL